MITAKCDLTIDLNIITDNYQLLRKICNTAEVGAAVKADCYGLGMEKIAPILEVSGCKHFFVANTEEGVALRKVLADSSSIYVLNGYFTEDQDSFARSNLIPILNSIAQIKLWQETWLETKKNRLYFLHIDTGMNRLGMPENEVKILLNDSSIDKNSISGVMSHLSSVENPDNMAHIEQLVKYRHLSAFFPNAKKSLANSSGIFLDSTYHFDIARPGGALYGINPAPYLPESGIKNPVTLFAPIIQINYLNEGEYVGYDRTYQAKSPRHVATLPLGYADGYLRSLSNKGIVYINNCPAPVIGRVSMDLITVDVSDIPEEDLFLGQLVEIIGPNMDIDKIADLAGTNGYEILTLLSDRYNRVYN